MALTIAELAHAGGVGVETVRFYQRKGLLPDPRPGRKMRSAGIRHYGAGDVRTLRFIRGAQGAGFTLAEIAELLALDSGTDRPRVRALANARLEMIDAQIAALEQARKALRRLTKECAHGEAGPCPIIAAFEAG